MKIFIVIVLLTILFVCDASGQIVLQRCDITNLWEGSNSITADTNNKKEGIASLSFTGEGSVWFQKLFSRTDAQIDETGSLALWLYVSDISKFNGAGQIEISSSGKSGVDAYGWAFADLLLVNGWNELKMPVANATVMGSPSLQSINFFRIHQPLSGVITAKIDFIRFTASEIEVIPTDPLDIPSVNFNTLDGKVMFGYQGWFHHPDDGSRRAAWHHWRTMQDEHTIGVEMFPDLREFEPDEKYLTGLTYADGRIARVFSSYNKKTVMRHMKWLRDYNLDGVFLQRFNVSLRDERLKEALDTVAVNIMAGCERYGRAFVNMWDLSGMSADCADELINDWKYLVDNLKITESPNYLHHRGKPLVAIWGFTVRDELPVADLKKMIDFFKNSPEEKYRASVMLGTNHDFFQRAAWQEQLKRVDVISPWSVGRYSNVNGHMNFINNLVRPGQDWCDKNNIDFLPVIWPGFSWYNLKREGDWQKNQIKRNGGNFYWTQSNRVISSNAKMVYIAMFDEVDEATAMFKVSENASQSPDVGYWLSLDADGYDLPSDWYLRLAKLTNQVVKGISPNHTVLVTPPDGIDDYKVQATHTRCGTTLGKLTFSYPQTTADSLLEFSIDNGLTYPFITPAGSSSMETPQLASGRYDVWMRRADGSFPTDLGEYNISDLNPDAVLIKTNATCGFDDGEIKIVVGDNPYMGPLQISIDGGNNYDVTTIDGTWTYYLDNLSPGSYNIWGRWADEACPTKLKQIEIAKTPIPITLLPFVNNQPIEMDGTVVRVCPGTSLTISVAPAENSWQWTWSGVNSFSASTPTVLISDSVTSNLFGRYEVSYSDNDTGCGNKLTFFIRLETECSATGIYDGIIIPDMKVYPNPTIGVVHFEGDLSRVKHIIIKDLLGREIFFNDKFSSDIFSVDFTNFKDGLYIYHIEDKEGGMAIGKIIRK